MSKIPSFEIFSYYYDNIISMKREYDKVTIFTWSLIVYCVFNHLSLYSFELTFRSCLASRKPSVEWKNAIMIHAHKMELTKYWKTSSNILTY